MREYINASDGMMHECSTGELLTRVAFMHHDDQGHDALIHYAVLEGLKIHMITQKGEEPQHCSDCG